MYISDNQYIQNVLINGIPNNTERFFRKKFDNASEEHVSTFRGELNRYQMIELKARVDEIVSGYEELTRGTIMTKEQRDLSKAMYIYNYILENVTYTQCQFAPNSSNVFGGNPMKNSIYGALVMHDAVCSGISEAIDCLCKVMNVESKKLLIAPNDPMGGGHAFNSIKVGDYWFKVDATSEIGMNPGHKIRGGKWKDRNFLVEFSDIHRQVCCPIVPDCPVRYSRELIEQMKIRLENRGLSFEYQQIPIITYTDVHSAVSAFLNDRAGKIDNDITRNFENAIVGSFNIISRNGVILRNRDIIYTQQNDILTATRGEQMADLYSNGDSRFVIKAINGNKISGFTILRRNGQIENRISTEGFRVINGNSNRQIENRISNESFRIINTRNDEEIR